MLISGIPIFVEPFWPFRKRDGVYYFALPLWPRNLPRKPVFVFRGYELALNICLEIRLQLNRDTILEAFFIFRNVVGMYFEIYGFQVISIEALILLR